MSAHEETVADGDSSGVQNGCYATSDDQSWDDISARLLDMAKRENLPSYSSRLLPGVDDGAVATSTHRIEPTHDNAAERERSAFAGGLRAPEQTMRTRPMRRGDYNGGLSNQQVSPTFPSPSPQPTASIPSKRKISGVGTSATRSRTTRRKKKRTNEEGEDEEEAENYPAGPYPSLKCTPEEGFRKGIEFSTEMVLSRMPDIATREQVAEIMREVLSCGEKNYGLEPNVAVDATTRAAEPFAGSQGEHSAVGPNGCNNVSPGFLPQTPSTTKNGANMHRTIDNSTTAQNRVPPIYPPSAYPSMSYAAPTYPPSTYRPTPFGAPAYMAPTDSQGNQESLRYGGLDRQNSSLSSRNSAYPATERNNNQQPSVGFSTQGPNMFPVGNPLHNDAPAAAAIPSFGPHYVPGHLSDQVSTPGDRWLNDILQDSAAVDGHSMFSGDQSDPDDHYIPALEKYFSGRL